jgi:hypothetical protein
MDQNIMDSEEEAKRWIERAEGKAEIVAARMTAGGCG